MSGDPRLPWRETPLVFSCQGEPLVGVLTQPQGTSSDVGAVVVVGGPQVRAGSHRQFVSLARSLATQGHAALRFDVRGMGDSGGEARDFTTLDDDIDSAIQAFTQHPSAPRRLVLVGLCDGASAALMYWQRRRDTRVAGLCVLNPWLRSDVGQARTQVKHYYVQRLLQPAFWRKLLSGGVGLRAVGDLGHNLRRARGAVDDGAALASESFRDTMAGGWRSFSGPLMLVLSGNDYTAKEFLDGVGREPAWRGALEKPGLTRVDLPDADHTFSKPGDKRACENAITGWLDQVAATRG